MASLENDDISPLELSTPEICSQESSTEDLALPQGGRGTTAALVSNLPRVQPTAFGNGAAAVDTDMPRAFRVMLNQLALRLDEDNVTSIVFIHQLPSQAKKGALKALQHLHQHGLFSWDSTQPLRKLLQDIDRHDLASSVLQEYETAYKQYQLARAALVLSQRTPSPGKLNDHRLEGSGSRLGGGEVRSD